MAIQVGIGLSTNKDPLRAAQEAVQKAKTRLGREKVDLALVFSTIEFAHPTILKTISNALGPVPLLGCSSFAIISDEGIFKYGLIIMLLTFSGDISCKTACVKNIKTKGTLAAGEELGIKLLEGLQNIRRNFGIIFSDGLISEGSSLVYGLQERLGVSFPLMGASASDNLHFLKTYIYYNQEIFSDGACAILWTGKLNFGLGVKHGWKPVGKPHTVTSALGNVIYEIDGLPAAQLYKEYLALSVAELRKRIKQISVLYPLGLYLEGEDEYLLRNIISIEEDASIVLQGDFLQGSVVRLMIGTKESCLDATHQAIEEVKTNLVGHAYNFVLVFNSISRYILLGRQAHKELEGIKEAFGRDTAIIGLYTYGEQAPTRAINYLGKAHLHNQTITIIGVRD